MARPEGKLKELKTAAPGNPWVFRADFVNRDALVDLALLAKGFRIVTGPVPYNADGPSRAHWDAVYKHLTDEPTYEQRRSDSDTIPSCGSSTL